MRQTAENAGVNLESSADNPVRAIADTEDTFMKHWQRVAVVGLGATALVGAAAVIGTAGASPSGAVGASTSGPVVREQQKPTSAALFAMYPAKTTISTSPVLATGTYVVNAVVTVGHIFPGNGATCGVSTSGGTDVNATDTGQLGNGNTSGSFLDGNCVITGTVKLNSSNDKVTLWAAASNGLGATLDNSSINETPVGSALVTH